jgi:hypothetical protein
MSAHVVAAFASDETIVAIVAHHDIGQPFYELPSCFYTRNMALEDAYCVPYTYSKRGHCIGE